MRRSRPRPFPIGLVAATLAFAALALVFASPSAAQTPIPGTTVSLDAPAGFTPSSAFSGLENRQDGSTITITELPPEAFADLSQVFSSARAASEGLASRGIRIDRRDEYAVEGQQVAVLIGTEGSPNGDVAKYMALYRGDVTVLITVNAFDAKILPPALVETTLKSVRLAAAVPLEEKVARLPFSFTPATPFHVQDTIGGSGVLLATTDDPDPTGLLPVVVIARALTAVDPASSVGLMAQRMLQATDGFQGAMVTASGEADFGGGPGYYLEAVAGNRTIMMFVRIPPDGAYLRLVAVGETAALQKAASAARDIAQSVTVP
jgi:hypothetical protein